MQSLAPLRSLSNARAANAKLARCHFLVPDAVAPFLSRALPPVNWKLLVPTSRICEGLLERAPIATSFELRPRWHATQRLGEVVWELRGALSLASEQTTLWPAVLREKRCVNTSAAAGPNRLGQLTLSSLARSASVLDARALSLSLSHWANLGAPRCSRFGCCRQFWLSIACTQSSPKSKCEALSLFLRRARSQFICRSSSFLISAARGIHFVQVRPSQRANERLTFLSHRLPPFHFRALIWRRVS